jgi:hypothetical protein
MKIVGLDPLYSILFEVSSKSKVRSLLIETLPSDASNDNLTFCPFSSG